MTLSLDKIKKDPGTEKKRKRVGRGNASGTGTYSSRGLKGQNARSGVSNLKRLGMRQTLLRTPKEKGFKSKNPKNQVVNLFEINKTYKESETVNPKTLYAKGLVDNTSVSVKILGNGELKLNGLKFENVKMSDKVKEQIKKSKGKIVESKKEDNKKVNNKK